MCHPQAHAHAYHTPRPWASTGSHRSVTKPRAPVSFPGLSPSPTPHLLPLPALSSQLCQFTCGPQPKCGNNSKHPRSPCPPPDIVLCALHILFHSRETKAWRSQMAYRHAGLCGKAEI